MASGGCAISPANCPEGYAAYSTFLYELIWNLGLAGFLVWLGNHRRIRPPGLFALYVTGYSVFRIFEETLRVDPAHHILGLRLNFFVACALALAGATWFIVSQRHGRSQASRKGAALLAIGWATLTMVGCGQGSRTSKTAEHGPPQPQQGADLAAR